MTQYSRGFSLWQIFLGQNYPDPYNLSTDIRYYVEEQNLLPIGLVIYNLKGRVVRDLSKGIAWSGGA